jgi:hypothetical protein
MTERPVKPFPPLANILDRLLEQAMQNESPSFRDLAKSAALDPARDFVGASLREVDFRDEDLKLITSFRKTRDGVLTHEYKLDPHRLALMRSVFSRGRVE